MKTSNLIIGILISLHGLMTQCTSVYGNAHLSCTGMETTTGTGGGDSLPSLMVINHLDTIYFNFSEATCTPDYIQVPVYMVSDDPVYALDFAVKFNPSHFTFHSFVNHKAYLNPAANYNVADSTLRFSSFSFLQPIESNTPLITVRFIFGSSEYISIASFDSIETQLNGDYCTNAGIDAGLSPEIISGGTPVIIPGDSIQLSINLLPGQTSLWSNGATGPVTWAFNPGIYTVIVTNSLGCSGISSLQIYAPDPLPITLIQFNAESVDNGIRVSWSTATEINNMLFSIERSADGNEWIQIKTLAGAGNSTTPLHYDYTDLDPNPGINYYRLKQTDYDGTVSCSRVVAERYLPFQNDKSIRIVPNPVVGNGFMLELPGTHVSIEGHLSIYDHLGKVVFSRQIIVPGSSGLNSEIFIEPGIDIASGNYMVMCRTDSYCKVVKMLVDR
jgi:hypothetical protein